MMKKGVILGIFMLLGSIVCVGQIDVGLGAKLVGQIPFGLLSLRYGSVTGEIAAGFSSASFSTQEGVVTLSLLWYSGLAKFYLLSLADFAELYVGGGAVGVTVTLGAAAGGATASISGSVFGLEGVAGVEVRFGALALFGGGDLLWFFAPAATGPQLGGFSYHIGIRYDFNF